MVRGLTRVSTALRRPVSARKASGALRSARPPDVRGPPQPQYGCSMTVTLTHHHPPSPAPSSTTTPRPPRIASAPGGRSRIRGRRRGCFPHPRAPWADRFPVRPLSTSHEAAREATMDAVLHRVSSPTFVGRADELAALDGALGRAAAGVPAFTFVAGESGVGKSRLVAELEARAPQRGRARVRRPLPRAGRGRDPVRAAGRRAAPDRPRAGRVRLGARRRAAAGPARGARAS